MIEFSSLKSIGSTGLLTVLLLKYVSVSIQGYSAEIGTVKTVKAIIKKNVIPSSANRGLSRFPFLEIVNDYPPKSDYGSMRTNKGVM